MKAKRQKRLVCFIMAIFLTFGIFNTSAEDANVSGSETLQNSSEGFSKKGSYSSAYDMLSDMKLAATDNGTELYYSSDTVDFAVRNTATDDIWTSSPYDLKNDSLASDAVKNRMASFIHLTYYDYQSNMYEMNGYTDCISKNQFSVKEIKNGIQIDMRIGKDENQLSLPLSAEADRFEEKVIDKLSGIAKRKMQAFYTRYSYNDDSLDEATKERIIELYPGLKEYDLYILRDDASDRDKQMLTEYIVNTDYTSDDYADDLLKSGSVDKANATALFKITLELTLNNGALCVNVPTDKIIYDKENFILSKINLLEYFGAGKSENDGYMFVPDGSGSLINFNSDFSKKIVSTVYQVYGKDYTLLENDTHQNLSQQSCLPVFGMKEASKAFLAIIEDGDAMAKITAQSGNIVSGYESVSSDFVYASVQTYLYDDGKKQNGQWTYFNKNYYKGNYRIRYEFLNGENADYSGMAGKYRNYLKDIGVLTKISTDKEVPLYIETIGLITRKDSFFGIPYNKDIDITSFNDAITICDELKESGVSNITLRYKGWMNGGLNNTVASDMSVEKKLGGIKGLKKLNQYITENDFSFYPEVNFNIVRHNTLFDGFTSIFDSPRSNDDHVAMITPAEEINNISSVQNQYSAISPSKTTKYYTGFFEKFKSIGINTVTIAYAGNMLYSDFAKNNSVSRNQSLEILENNIKTNAVSQGKIMTDGGNAYIFPYTGDILGTPLSDSGSITENQSIPFMQMVLHGYIRYAGSAVNLSQNIKTSLLKSAETGAGLYFSVGYKNTEYLKDTTFSYLYSVDYKTWKSDITELYTKYNKAFSNLQECEITDHEKFADNLYITTYEDGSKVFTNYNKDKVNVNGITVPGEDFIVIK